MFGDMFEESETLVQGCAPKPSKQNGNTFEAPPPLRGDTGFCGIKNQGATCYLNSLIQTLLLTPEFREELFRLGPDELGKLDDVKKKNSKVRIIPIQLQMLLARLLLIEQYACGTEGLTESFGWVDNEELQQHDVQELSRILFCAIEDSLVGTSGHEIIKNLYRGVIANTTKCLNCKKVSERPEDFLDLNVAIASQSTLCDVLRDMFVETELMSGKNQYHCDNCAKLVDARKGAIIKTLPPILTVSLLRFSFDYQTLRRFKEIVKTRDAESKEKHSAKAKKNSKQKKVQSKSKPKRSSIKQPSTLQDGDLVRVKKIVPNLDNAPVVTDFKSEEEVALYGRWCVSRHKESNSLSANQPPENEAKKANPKKEETLRIHVDKF